MPAGSLRACPQRRNREAAMAHAQVGRPFPKAALIGAAGLVALSIASAAVSKWTGFGHQQRAPSEIVAAAELVFLDRPDGGIDVTANGRTIVLAPGSNGFVRGIVRGLARDRKVRGIGPDVPFRLMLRADEVLLLADPATGGVLDLGAYGSENGAAFGALLAKE